MTYTIHLLKRIVLKYSYCTRVYFNRIPRGFNF